MNEGIMYCICVEDYFGVIKGDNVIIHSMGTEKGYLIFNKNEETFIDDYHFPIGRYFVNKEYMPKPGKVVSIRSENDARIISVINNSVFDNRVAFMFTTGDVEVCSLYEYLDLVTKYNGKK